MATLTGTQLAQNIRKGIKELKKVSEGVNESTASGHPRAVGRPRKFSPPQRAGRIEPCGHF